MEMYEKSNIKHIAFIMDGNGRWAKKRSLPRFLGHKAGVDRIDEIIKECRRLNFEVVSFFCFSTENWKRPQDEIDHLFKYLGDFFVKEMPTLKKLEIRINISGDISRLPKKTQEIVLDSIEETKFFNKMVFNICLNYSGREEIIKMCRDFASDCLNNLAKPEDLNEVSIRKYLYIKDLPDIDLLVRTSGEVRISNFMLYNLAYSEIIFNSIYWPDYTIDALHQDIETYMKRSRRFGGLNDGK
jgi:undecaprenyl diphosphate synthase